MRCQTGCVVGLYNSVKLAYNSAVKISALLICTVDFKVNQCGFPVLSRKRNCVFEGMSFLEAAWVVMRLTRYVLHNDGLFLGSSAAMNLVGAVKVARELGALSVNGVPCVRERNTLDAAT